MLLSLSAVSASLRQHCIKKPLCFLLQLIIWQKSSGWTLATTSPARCASLRRSAGTVWRRGGSTRRASCRPISPNSSTPRKRGRAREKRAVGRLVAVTRAPGVKCVCLCGLILRELERCRQKQEEKSDDSRVRQRLNEIHTKHVGFYCEILLSDIRSILMVQNIKAEMLPANKFWFILFIYLQDKYLSDLEELFCQVDEKRKVSDGPPCFPQSDESSYNEPV